MNETIKKMKQISCFKFSRITCHIPYTHFPNNRQPSLTPIKIRARNAQQSQLLSMDIYISLLHHPRPSSLCPHQTSLNDGNSNKTVEKKRGTI